MGHPKTRLVAYAVYNFPNFHVNPTLQYLTNGWKIDHQLPDAVLACRTRPAPAVGLLALPGSPGTGAGGPAFIPQLGPSPITTSSPESSSTTCVWKRTWCSRNRYHLQLLGKQAFNVANHQNVSAFAASYLYSLSGTTATYTGVNGTGNKSFMVPSNSNSSNFTYSPRNVRNNSAARINF